MKSSADMIEVDLPIIETGRLLLRMFEVSDLDSMVRLFIDAEVQKYLSPENRRTREQMRITLQNLIRHWKERGFGLWCVSKKRDNKMLGYCGFQYFDQTSDREILFAFFKDFWGKGFATEAADACLKFGFEKLLFERVFAATHPENAASRCVLEKIGMVCQEKTTHYGIDTIAYEISRCNFKPSKDFYKLRYENFSYVASGSKQDLRVG